MRKEFLQIGLSARVPKGLTNPLFGYLANFSKNSRSDVRVTSHISLPESRVQTTLARNLGHLRKDAVVRSGVTSVNNFYFKKFNWFKPNN